MEASYIGRRGTHLFMAYDSNQVNVDPLVPSFLIMQQNRALGCAAAGTGCPTGVTGVTPSLLTTLQTQGGMTAAAAATFLNSSTTVTDLNRYTFGKSIDNQSVDPVGASSGGGLSTTNSRTPTDIRNFREERARSDFDRTHVLQSAAVWEVPVGKGKRFLGSSHGVVNQLLGGWTINTIYTFMTGEPFAVRSGSFTYNGSHESRAGVVRPVTAQLQYLPNQTFAGPVLFQPVELNPVTGNPYTCGTNPNVTFCMPVPGTNGAGRNIFVASNYWNADLGFIKVIQISERVKLQFRTEMFNAFNHANFDNPRDASVGSPSIRSGLFAQVCCAAVAPPSTQSVVQTGESARVIQFALKLMF